MAPAKHLGSREAWAQNFDKEAWSREVIQNPPSACVADVPDLLEKIQAHIYQRRIRVKETFLDFDPLRSGRCTPQQFVRAVTQLVPIISQAEGYVLAEYFTEQGHQVQRPQVVNYVRFVKSADEVFVAHDLEKQPKATVPRPGSSLQTLSFRPVAVTDEAKLNQIIRRIALLSKTRGVSFMNCFQDCERSDAVSLTCPRYSGKVTQSQFMQHFPFQKDFSESEVRLLMKRYGTQDGVVYVQALHRDIQDIPLAELMPERPGSTIGTRHRQPATARGAMTARPERSHATQEETPVDEAAALLDKLRAIVAERRLRLSDTFFDFDRLRRGVCSIEKVKTVFTILRIEVSKKDLAVLATLYPARDGMFNFRDFCTAINEVPSFAVPELTTDLDSPRSQEATSLSPSQLNSPTAFSPTSCGARGFPRRPRGRLDAQAEAKLSDVEVAISKRCQTRRLPLKQAFQDFDGIRTGRVTRTQFMRIMNGLLGCSLTDSQISLLCQAYCDSAGAREFNYAEFCQSVDDRQCDISFDHLPYYSARPPSRYFDRSGQVMPLPLVQMEGAWTQRPPRPATR